MKQIPCTKTVQEHYKKVMLPFEELMSLTRPSDSEDYLRRLSIYIISQHAATRREKAEMRYLLLEIDTDY